MDYASPAAAIKKIGEELKEKFDECGMGSVEALGDKLEEIKDMAEKGPDALLEALQGGMKSMVDKLEEVKKNPSSLAPSGGLAQCADWYGSSVAGRLSAMSEEVNSLKDMVLKLGSDIGDPLKKLKEVLGGVMKCLETSLKRLAKLPAEITKLGDSVKGPDDVAKIDTESMKKCTDTSGIEGELKKILDVKDLINPAVEAAKAAIAKLAEFVMNAPDMVRAAFDVPQPLCFLTSVLLSQAPEAMTSLLEMVDKLKAVDLEPMQKMLTDTADTLTTMDLEKVKEPVGKFGTFATEKVDALDKVVAGAKMTSGGGALGGVMNAFG